MSEISKSIAANLKLTGPALLSHNPEHVQKLLATITALITQKHPCQEELTLEAEDADLSDMETTEFDWLVVDTGMDVIGGLAVALGPGFTEVWKMFEKTVLKYATGSEALERATATGVLAEIINGMASAVTPETGKLMQLLLKRLGDEDPQTKSNAAYAVGRLVEKSDDDTTILKAYPQILGKLEGLLDTEEARCKDNAAGCASRMIMKHKSDVPVQQILQGLIGILPLENDYEENEPVFQMIVQLCKFPVSKIGGPDFSF